MPRVLMCMGPEEMAFQDFPELPLEPTQVRIRTEFGAEKHGTMMGFFKGYSNARGAWDPELQLFRPGGMYWEYPLPLGNMIVGTIIEVGESVTEKKVGERVYAYSGFADSCATDQSACWTLPDGVAWQSAVMLDPAEFALGAIRDGHVRAGDIVAVFGMGALGLASIQIMESMGLERLIAIDPLPARRELAEKFGADTTLDPTGIDAGMELKLMTGKRGPDVIIDFSASQHALQHAFRGLAYGGTIVEAACQKPFTAGFDLGAEAHKNKPTLVFSRACSQPDFDHPRWTEERTFSNCHRFIREGKIRGEEVVTPIVDFRDLMEEYPKIASEPNRCIKMGVKFQQ